MLSRTLQFLYDACTTRQIPGVGIAVSIIRAGYLSAAYLYVITK